MKLHCPTCAAVIPSEDINLDRMVAKCRACSTVFGFGDQLPSAAAPLVRRERAQIALPGHFAVEDSAERFALTRRWFNFTYFFMAFFTVAWNAFLLVWYSIALKPGSPWIMAVFPIAHVAVGLFLIYSTITGFVNRTVLSLDGEGLDSEGNPYRSMPSVKPRFLTVKHGPLPWPGNLALPCDEVEQLFTREQITRTRNGSTTTYEVHARLRGGVTRKLIASLPNADQALFIEQQLERRLGIVDEPVAGELPR